MTLPVLVAYATKRESTHEVADAVAATLRELDHGVEVRPAAEVTSLSSYGAVVIGGALYMGRWHRRCAPLPLEAPRGAHPPARRRVCDGTADDGAGRHRGVAQAA